MGDERGERERGKRGERRERREEREEREERDGVRFGGGREVFVFLARLLCNYRFCLPGRLPCAAALGETDDMPRHL